MNTNKIINSGNISITGSDNGIVFPDGTVLTSADNAGGGITGTAVWVSKRFEWADGRSNSIIIGSHTVGPNGGYMGTVEGPFGMRYCTDHMEYYVNDIRLNITGFRVNQYLNPGDVVVAKKCWNSGCTTDPTGTCRSTSVAWVRIGLWDF
ncbi:MAG: hypothetical protein K0B07_02405 [DPANN group archaeon]|nr:hypothetical protein [DPANN group archaeon]